MQFTPKEGSLLQELQAQEKLCIEKYGKYADAACDPRLRQLFSSIGAAESRHLQTLEGLGSGSLPQQQGQQQQSQQGQQQGQQQQSGGRAPAQNSPEWQQDRYLCTDALTTEKHASGLYDTGIFEFADPAVRQTLNSIQSEEQRHGQSIYEYMNSNGMYN